MKAIIAVNNLGYIGLNNDLPWRCSEDLKHFKALTSQSHMGNQYPILLVGYNTMQTLPKLGERQLWVPPKRSFIYHSDIQKVDWCIGGKITYERFCNLFTELHISHINDNTVGDTFFPNLMNLNPDCKITHYYFEPNKE